MRQHDYKTMKAELRLTATSVIHKNAPMLVADDDKYGIEHPPLTINIEAGNGDVLVFEMSRRGYGVYDYAGLLGEQP